MWEDSSYETKLRILEGQSTVFVGILLQDATLVEMIRRGDTEAACLDYINENF